jgi:hypothetical protein
MFVDTEWTAAPWSDRPELMWIGLAGEEGRSWYGISSEVEIDPSTNDFISGVFRLITPDEPRLSRAQIAAAVSTSAAGWASSGRGSQRSKASRSGSVWEMRLRRCSKSAGTSIFRCFEAW